eukprot:TRINITY_DN950_c0_g1_i2.p1 TRINITY_DN950_c0_g1~~TRINITY_DN950_c0_g1_i2.p1  ORF type:complete len:1900 (+),score=439.49 TRINITY_DN950_c0_g1_i2:41-5740(+)
MVRSEAAKASEKRRRKARAVELAMYGTPQQKEAAKASEKRRRKMRELEQKLGLAPRTLTEDTRMSGFAVSLGLHSNSIRQCLDRGDVVTAVSNLQAASHDPSARIDQELIREVVLKCIHKAEMKAAQEAVSVLYYRQLYPNVRFLLGLLSQVSQKSDYNEVQGVIDILLNITDFGTYDQQLLEPRVNYCRHFLSLMMQEFLEEAAQAFRRISSMNPHVIEDQGLGMMNIGLQFTKSTLVQLAGRASNPYCFLKGDCVLVSPMDFRFEGVEGEVVTVGERMQIKLSHAFPFDLRATGSIAWRIDKMGNRTSLCRQLDAIRRLVEVRETAKPAQSAHHNIHDALLFAPLPNGHMPNNDYVAQCCNEVVRQDRGVIATKLNGTQQEALHTALTKRVSLIHGPPGTGKTTTSIAVLKAWVAAGLGPVLATSDSNTAVDNLVTGLVAAGVNVIRLGRPEAIRQDLNEYTLDYIANNAPQDMARDQLFLMQQQMLRRAEVVCATCSGCGVEIIEKVTFRAVLVDEASQATEPSTLVPLMHGALQVALVGDHKQLPPTILSRSAELGNLGVSLFDRLVHAGVKPSLLAVQYRMHPVLATYPSLAMYEGRVSSGVESSERPIPEGIDWPVPSLPICFVPVDGPDTPDGMSHFNRNEAQLVVNTVNSLLSASKLSPTQIGIITPYAAQVKLLRRMLGLPRGASRGRTFTSGSSDKGGLEVNSVDGFQGREKEVIVVSAVRSNQEGQVGFLSDPRRLNVMLTRAKRGLIVFGNVETLRNDTGCWAPWLEWVMRHGLVQGRPAADAVAQKNLIEEMKSNLPPVPVEVLQCNLPGRGWPDFCALNEPKALAVGSADAKGNRAWGVGGVHLGDATLEAACASALANCKKEGASGAMLVWPRNDSTTNHVKPATYTAPSARPNTVPPTTPPVTSPGVITQCIRMRGLPWSCNEGALQDFFKPLRITRVNFLYDRTGKPKGECFVRFETDDMAKQAMKMDRQYMGHRFVECYLTNIDQADRVESMLVDQTKDSCYVRLRGLPFSAKERDISNFLAEHGITAVDESVVIEFGSDGRHSGCATVKLASTEHTEKAISLHRNVRFGSRYVEIFKTTEEDALQAEKTHGGAGARDSFVVKLRGLPMTSSEADVITFLVGVKIATHGIHMVDNDYGRANGTCFVQVEDSADLDTALEKDGGQMGNRYIEVHRSTVAAMSDNHPPPKDAEMGGPYVVWLRGLPFTVTGVDIVKQLFPDIDIVPQGVHLVLEDDGRSHGQAYVELANEHSMREALSRTGRLMCKNYAQQASHTGRSVDIIRSSMNSMYAAGGFVHEDVAIVKRKHPGESLGCQLDGLKLAGVVDGSALVRHGGEQFVGRIIRRVNDIDITDPVCLSKALASNSTADTVTLRFQHVPYVQHPKAAKIRDLLTGDCNHPWAQQWMQFCHSQGMSCEPVPATIDMAISVLGEPPAPSGSRSPVIGNRINLAQRQRDVVAKIGKSIMQRGENYPPEADPIKYAASTRLLLVGEGNFSYAAALCQHFGHAPNVVATGYDSYTELLKLPGGEGNATTAKRCGATVLHEIDATKLQDLRSKLGDFDAIRWNNPHSGAYPTGAENVASNQCLLEAFLRSAVHILRPGGEIHIVSSQHSMKKWRIEEMGQPVVACVKIERHVNPFDSYVSQRSRGGALPDAAHTVKIYTFRRAAEISHRHDVKVIRAPVYHRPPTTLKPSKNQEPSGARHADVARNGAPKMPVPMQVPMQIGMQPKGQMNMGFTGYPGHGGYGYAYGMQPMPGNAGMASGVQGYYGQQSSHGYRPIVSTMDPRYHNAPGPVQYQPHELTRQGPSQQQKASHSPYQPVQAPPQPFLQMGPSPPMQAVPQPIQINPIGYQQPVQLQPQLLHLGQFGYPAPQMQHMSEPHRHQ